MNQKPVFPILNQIASNWWTFLLRGIIAILFGVCALTCPLSLVYVFGTFIFFDGVLALFAALFGYGKNNRIMPTWWLVIMGICGILAGIITWRQPIIAAEMGVIIIGSWALVSGIFSLFGSFDIPSGVQGKGMLIFNAVMSILFGILVFAWPGAGALSIMWVIALYAILAGVFLCIFSFNVRNAPKDAEKLAGQIDRDLRA